MVTASTPADRIIYLPARRWTRTKIDVAIKIVRGKNRPISGRGGQISDGGMAISADIELKMGEKIGVEFIAKNGTPLRIHALVCTREKYCYGLEFLSSNPREEEEVAKFRSALRNSALAHS